MVLEGIMLSEIKSDRERHILYVLTYRRNLKKKKKELKDTENRLMVSRGGGLGRAKWMKGG